MTATRETTCARCAAPLAFPGVVWCGACWKTVRALTEERFPTDQIEAEKP